MTVSTLTFPITANMTGNILECEASHEAQVELVTGFLEFSWIKNSLSILTFLTYIFVTYFDLSSNHTLSIILK